MVVEWSKKPKSQIQRKNKLKRVRKFLHKKFLIQRIGRRPPIRMVRQPKFPQGRGHHSIDSSALPVSYWRQKLDENCDRSELEITFCNSNSRVKGWPMAAYDIQNKFALYFEAKSHWIQAGIEAGTFWSWVARTAIWATMLWFPQWLLLSHKNKKQNCFGQKIEFWFCGTFLLVI